MNGVDQTIYTALAADSALTSLLGGSAVYHILAPQGATTPYVVFQDLGGPDSYTYTRRVWTDLRYQIKCVHESNSGLLAGSVMARVDALLTDASLSFGGTAGMIVRRTRTIPDYAEVEAGGQRVNHKGAIFQIGVHG